VARELPDESADTTLMSLIPKCGALVLAALVVLASPPAAAAQDEAPLQAGWRMMYGLDFRAAEQVFQRWQRDHPRDPFGPMSMAASLLFEELSRMGILQAQFFVDDASLVDRRPVEPDPNVRVRFEAALAETDTLARSALATEPRDADAIFALTMVYGLRADYAGLIQARNMAFLANSRKAAALARTLLEAAPDYADAHLATGVTEYVVGSLFTPVRWVLRLAGYAGDTARGMDEVRVTAERGRFLAPFARILLAIAYLRRHDTARARELVAGLARDFPTNPLFANELQRLDSQGR
jgi:hypothetical protein